MKRRPVKVGAVAPARRARVALRPSVEAASAWEVAQPRRPQGLTTAAERAAKAAVALTNRGAQPVQEARAEARSNAGISVQVD
jgi:hypothetical protein